MANIFTLPPQLPEREFVESLVSGQNLAIERIISTGHTTPMGEWYDQNLDEWVIVLQGEATLAYADGSKLEMKPGDYVFLPAHQLHRVDRTTNDPPCIWLAVHADLRK
jgi:cupin 2 domain-containing protein